MAGFGEKVVWFLSRNAPLSVGPPQRRPSKELACGNIFIRRNVCAKAGDGRDGHKHNFDHTTIVFKGAVHVRAKFPNGGVIEQDFHAPAHFLVKAEVEHLILALEDDTEFLVRLRAPHAARRHCAS